MSINKINKILQAQKKNHFWIPLESIEAIKFCGASIKWTRTQITHHSCKKSEITTAIHKRLFVPCRTYLCRLVGWSVGRWFDVIVRTCIDKFRLESKYNCVCACVFVCALVFAWLNADYFVCLCQRIFDLLDFIIWKFLFQRQWSFSILFFRSFFCSLLIFPFVI